MAKSGLQSCIFAFVITHENSLVTNQSEYRRRLVSENVGLPARLKTRSPLEETPPPMMLPELPTMAAPG